VDFLKIIVERGSRR